MVSYPRTYAALVAALKRDEIPPFFPPSLPLKDVPEVTNVYRCLDPIHAAMRDGRYDDAFARLLLAIRQCVKIGFREGTQKFVNLIAQIERARGELDRERDARLLELDILQGRKVRKEEIAEALMVLASLDTLRGDTDAAARTMERLLGFEGWRNNVQDIAQAYDVMGHSYAQLGDFIRALDWYQRALALKENASLWNPESRGIDGEKQTLEQRESQIFNSYRYLMRLSLRFAKSDEILDYVEKFQVPKWNRFDSLVGLSECFLHVDDFNALKTSRIQNFLQSLRDQLIQCEKEDSDRLGNYQRLCLRHMIVAARLSVEEDEAILPYLQQLIVDCRDLRARQLSIPYDHGYFRYIYVVVIWLYKNLRLLSQVQRRKKNWAAAIAALEEAIAVWPRAGTFYPSSMPWDNFREKEAGLRLELAQLFREAGRRDDAVKTLYKARAAVPRMISQAEQVLLFGQLAREWQALQMPAEREEALLSAVALYESLRSRVADPTQILLYPEFTDAPLYGGLAELAVEKKKPALDALTLLEKGRSQALSLLLAQGHVELDRLLSPAEKREMEALRKRVQQAGAGVRAAATKGDQDKNYLSARRGYDRLVLELTQRQATLRSRFSSPQAASKAAPPTPSALRGLAKARPDTLFVSFSVGEDTLTVFLLSAQEGVRAERLPLTRRWLVEQGDAWRKALRTTTLQGQRDEARLAEKLGAALWPALAPSLSPEIKRLVFVPEGPLHALPFAALVLPGGKRLVERYPVSHALSLSALLLPGPKRPTPRQAFLALADPPMGVDDTLPLASVRKRLGALPFARTEARTVARGFSPATLLIGPDATEQNLRPKLAQSRILHFATHGIVDPVNGLRSWLLLAPPTRDDENDGRLEAREIAASSLSADLAVLSACETGLGQVSASEGLLGFAWAFHVAGCPSVVGSLWTIDDRATGPLMEIFYTRLRAGDPKDRALQAAMQSALKTPATRAPYYWAAFLLTGDPSPLKT